MALLLSGERPTAAAVSLNPFRIAVTWLGKVRAANARRQALHNLLGLPSHRLDDLGINRSDLFDAMGAEPTRGGRLLAERRAQTSSHWLNP
jgi:uncharacterized protein YjiS (DUF1127 family)